MWQRFKELLLWKPPVRVNISTLTKDKRRSFETDEEYGQFLDTISRHIKRATISLFESLFAGSGLVAVGFMHLVGRCAQEFPWTLTIILVAVWLIERCAASKELQAVHRLLDIKI
ncbi:MAG: hypothetical protein AAB727_01170 [Patescibacteria group bacterium]